MLSRNILYYGKEEAPPLRRNLRAGPLTLVYDHGDLRNIQYGENEILSRIYIALRDRNWGTVENILVNEKVEATTDSFRISYEATNRQDEIDFEWQAVITGDNRGQIAFRFDGKAKTTFIQSRIGFCLLHPMRACAGKLCLVESTEGDVRRGVFPILIAPGEIHPFLDMKGMKYEIEPDVWVDLQFSGDLFEMEDQRNWTDASFKTFCTPLRLGAPREIQADTRVEQSITLSITGVQAKNLSYLAPTPRKISIAFDLEKIYPLPHIGLGCASHRQSLNPLEISRLNKLHLSHLRLDLEPDSPKLLPLLGQGWEQARTLRVPLEIALHFSNGKTGIDHLRTALTRIRPEVCRWLIFHQGQPVSDGKRIRQARNLIVEFYPGAIIGGGSNADFNELNNSRPSIEEFDFISYSINPQVHAYDSDSLAEMLPTQGVTVETAHTFTDAKPVVVSPVTLKQRFNPAALGPEERGKPGELPSQVDVRQVSLFAAGWTTGSIKYLASSGVSSITYYETTGWRGVMETSTGSLLPDRFHSLPGTVYPLYHVFADVGEFGAGEVIQAISSDPLKVDILALRKNDRMRFLAVNLSPDIQTVILHGLPSSVLLQMLDEKTAEVAITDPEIFRAFPGVPVSSMDGQLELSLLPYAVARIDSVIE